MSNTTVSNLLVQNDATIGHDVSVINSATIRYLAIPGGVNIQGPATFSGLLASHVIGTDASKIGVSIPYSAAAVPGTLVLRGAGGDIAGVASSSSVLTPQTIGSYVPTATAVQNVTQASITSHGATFVRLGNIVLVEGSVTLTPTLNTNFYAVNLSTPPGLPVGPGNTVIGRFNETPSTLLLFNHGSGVVVFANSTTVQMQSSSINPGTDSRTALYAFVYNLA